LGRVAAGKLGAYVRGRKVKPPQFSGRRLCRICSEELVAARVKAILLNGDSFLLAQTLTGVPDSSIIRHARLCLDPETQTAIEAARRAKRYCGRKPNALKRSVDVTEALILVY
jgi:hypothetical protein